MRTLESSQVPKRAGNVRTIDLGASAVLYATCDVTERFLLNVSAAAIWDLTDGKKNIHEICAELAHACSIPSESIKTEVINAIHSMCDLGLMELKVSVPT